ncbi:helix-turn-helix transcriptional regulator [Clostridium botulinum]|nr:transcriptional regulator [Clostridium botulinum]MBY6802495.1 helix-turn-helix transcriptional regulator [Clostridium botulinum]MBY6812632.1 helix-turn-helix transcriptional regulator [Clostridium botulinum]MBY6819260.1 helix-turn-helix transcriptional regulator [Clostridium botulinum]NFJ50675.1 helix-turn-helix transcriptional regulator [Clostridium botulinum]
MIKYNNKKYVCLLDLAIDSIRGKWKAVILCHLLNEPKRFLELQRITNGVSHKVLTEKLKELEEDNLIQKIVYDENPPKVEYKLTPMGKDLSMAIKEIEKWSLKYYGNIVKEV